MGDLNELPFLIGTSALVFVSFLFGIIAVATSGWTQGQYFTFLEQYNKAPDDDKEQLLWLVGIVVLIILGIICLSFTGVIVAARFFGHSKGRAKLGGFLSLFSAAAFIIALAIFMGNNPPTSSTYGYSFGLLWTAVPLSLAAGVIMMMLPDSAFLNSELKTYSAAPGLH